MARPFRFRLETVLSIRRQREDQQKRVLAARLSEWGALRARAQTIDVQINQEVEAARELLRAGPMEAVRIARQRFWLGHLRRMRHDTGGHLEEIEGMLNRERRILSERTTERNVLEKLRERLETRHRTEVARAERLEADELAIGQAGRRARSEEDELSC